MRSGKPLPLRVPDKVKVLAEEMVRAHGAVGITDYICGLVILDVFNETDPEDRAQRLAGVAIPGWTSRLILAKPPRPNERGIDDKYSRAKGRGKLLISI